MKTRMLTLSLPILSALTLSACMGMNQSPSAADTSAAARSVDALNGTNSQGQYQSAAVPVAYTTQNSTSTAKTIPSTNSNLNVGDVLNVNVFKVPDLSAQNLTVENGGSISLPLVGNVAVAGMSIAQAEQVITQRLGQFMQSPQVSISRTNKSIENRVTVEGEVKVPGVFPIKGNLSFLQAIALSQGLTELADSQKIFFYRDGQRYPVNLDLVRTGTIADPILRNDDRIVVLRDKAKERKKKILDIIPVVTSPFSLFQ